MYYLYLINTLDTFVLRMCEVYLFEESK